MEWVSVKDDLPKDGERVIILLKDTNTKRIYAADFIKGITKEERAKMKNEELLDQLQKGWCASEGWTEYKRSNTYRLGDEHGNNTVGYAWQDGPYQWFGQDVLYWARATIPENKEV